MTVQRNLSHQQLYIRFRARCYRHHLLEVELGAELASEEQPEVALGAALAAQPEVALGAALVAQLEVALGEALVVAQAAKFLVEPEPEFLEASGQEEAQAQPKTCSRPCLDKSPHWGDSLQH